ncbi:GNAT family N-acetyltransferase [Paraburkholderia xenovorans]|uniref:GNAT family N-acetyltransferase n=1 Tax=Paraburkholderia xenovorans TaxID=36873 RepID=UPI0038B6EDEC
MKNAGAVHEIITDEAGFRALQPEWDELWTRAGGWYYQAFGNCRIAWDQVAKPLGRKLHVIVRREQGRAVLIFPLVTYRRALWTYLIPLCSESADFTSILVEDNARTAELVEDAWQVARTRCGADFVHMPYLPDRTDLYRLAMQERHPVIREHTPSYFANLHEESARYDWKGFCETLGRLHGNKPGKVEQRLAAAGKVRVDVIDSHDPVRIAASVDALLTWKRMWGERVGKHGHWLYSEHYRNFLVEWLSTEGSEVTAHAIVVTVDDAAVAVLLMCKDARGVTGIIASFDPAFAKWSPGILAVETMAKWAFERHLDLDCGAGSEAFKAYWSRGNASYCCTAQSVNSWWGFAGLCARRAPRSVVRRVRALSGHVETPEVDRSVRPAHSPADGELAEQR